MNITNNYHFRGKTSKESYIDLLSASLRIPLKGKIVDTLDPGNPQERHYSLLQKILSVASLCFLVPLLVSGIALAIKYRNFKRIKTEPALIPVISPNPKTPTAQKQPVEKEKIQPDLLPTNIQSIVGGPDGFIIEEPLIHETIETKKHEDFKQSEEIPPGLTNHSLINHEFNTTNLSDPINRFPPELVLKIFSNLNIFSLGRCSSINKEWKQFTIDPIVWKNAIYREVAFKNADWGLYFGKDKVTDEDDSEEFRSLPLSFIEILKNPCKIFPGKRGIHTHSLVRMPKTLNKRLTMIRFGELAKQHFPKSEMGYQCFYPEVLKELGNKSIKQSRWLLVTNDVLKNSINNTSLAKIFLDDCTEETKHPYALPNTLERTLCSFAKYFMAKTNRFALKDSLKDTICQETVQGRQVFVGRLSPWGLFLSSLNQDYSRIGIRPILRSSDLESVRIKFERTISVEKRNLSTIDQEIMALEKQYKKDPFALQFLNLFSHLNVTNLNFIAFKSLYQGELDKLFSKKNSGTFLVFVWESAKPHQEKENKRHYSKFDPATGLTISLKTPNLQITHFPLQFINGKLVKFTKLFNCFMQINQSNPTLKINSLQPACKDGYEDLFEDEADPFHTLPFFYAK